MQKVNVFKRYEKRNGKRRKGSGLLMTTLLVAGISSAVALTTVKISQSTFSSMNATHIATQAEQYALGKADILKATTYANLTAQSRSTIQNSNGYESEVIVSSETEVATGVRQRFATINVYRTGESLPRATLVIPKSNAEVETGGGGGVPIGTIIAWASSTAPSAGGTWLLCNGQSCSAYPELSALIGSKVPNLNGRFLEGTIDSPRSTKEAGLPDIQGRASFQPHGSTLNGAFTSGSGGSGISGGGSKFYGGCTQFKASSYNSIYGKSTTVQPASYLVRYYIKAAD